MVGSSVGCLVVTIWLLVVMYVQPECPAELLVEGAVQQRGEGEQHVLQHPLQLWAGLETNTRKLDLTESS